MARRRPEPSSLEWLWIIGRAFFLGLILSATYVRLNVQGDSPPVSLAPRADWARQFPLSVDAVTAALQHIPVPLPTPQQNPRRMGGLRWTQRHYAVSMRAPEDPDVVQQWFHALEAAAPAVSVRIVEDASGAEAQIGIDGLLTHRVSLRWLGHRPRAAIVMTHLGDDLMIVRDAISLGLQITLAIDPWRPVAREAAELAKLSQLEILLEIPFPAEEDPDVDWVEKLQHALDAFPQATGIMLMTAPMGSLQESGLRALLLRASERQMFAFDAAPDPQARLCETVVRGALRCSTRDIRLDPLNDPESIRVQVESAMSLVRSRGDIVAVGTAHTTTVATLRHMTPAFRAAQIEVAPLSRLMAERDSLSTH